MQPFGEACCESLAYLREIVGSQDGFSLSRKVPQRRKRSRMTLALSLLVFKPTARLFSLCTIVRLR
jgi:hypothetical protein